MRTFAPPRAPEAARPTLGPAPRAPQVVHPEVDMLGYSMFGFLIKKAFFDMWDNLIRVVILNLGFILIFAVLVYFPLVAQSVPVLFYLAIAVGVILLFVYSGMVSAMVSRIADYGRPEFRDAAGYLKETWPTSLLFALVNLVLVFLFSVAFPVYSQVRSFLGPLASSFLFWILIFWVLAMQFFFPVQSRLDKKFPKILKKMFLLFLDNPLFSLGLLIGAVATLALSAFTALLLPGIASILLWWSVALKLRIYKYDYLEEHPEARRNIPWDALLVEDRERVGKRTLKGMIFPWKE